LSLEYNDSFALLVLTLRKQAGLTQVELATLVGVTEKAVRNWEAGTAFPPENRLKKLIGIYLGLGAFTPGQERAEAKTLWKQACQTASHRKAIFNEAWFTVLLTQQRHHIFKATASVQRADPLEDLPRLRGKSAPSRKDPAADQLAPLSPAPFRLRQVDRAEASEAASPLSPLASSGQSDRLLAAKLMVPSRRPRLVPRAHLTQRLQAEPGRKLTLLVAPAGFGKTTLLLDWITSGRQRTAWLSLEADDNSPVRFWHYVVAALQTVRPSWAPRRWRRYASASRASWSQRWPNCSTS